MLDVDHNNVLHNRKEASSSFCLNLRIKENMLAQKYKVKWLNDGDCNSNFFHKVMKEMRRYKHIGPERERMVLHGISFNNISMEERLALEDLCL